jgi:hypothetical protein
MVIGLATTDKNSVAVVRSYTGQGAQIGHIGIYGKGVGDNLNPAVETSPTVKPVKLVGNSATALSKTHYYKFHYSPPY